MTALAEAPLEPAPVAQVRVARTAATLTRGARWLTVGTLTVGALNYAYAFVLTRLLSPTAYAHFAAGQALLLTAGTVAAVSMPWVLAQELVQAGSAPERRRAVRFATAANTVQGTVVGLAAGVVASTFSSWPTSVVVGVSALLIFLASTSLGWFQAGQHYRAIATRGVGEVVCKIVFGLALVAVGAGGGGALAGFGAGGLLLTVVGSWLMRADYGPVSGGLGSSQLWRSTAGVTAIQGLVSVLASVDVVLVAVLPVAPGAAASYQASMILARVPLFLAGAVAAVIFPMLAAASSAPADLLRSGSRLYLVVALPLSLALLTAPPALLSPLFPDSYDQLGPLLRLTAVAGLLLGLIELLTTYFQAAGHYRACVVRQAAGVVVALVAVPLGWHLYGVHGIAAGSLAGAGVTVALLLERAARTWPGCVALPTGGLLLVGALAGALLVLRPHPLLWLLLASGVLLACARTAFLPRPQPRHAAPLRLIR